MANGLPDNEAINEEEQTNELDVLNNTMSSVKDVLVAQLESLKSIARWQDQTALYTSHLQNIKVDMNQVRKWGEPISQIAQRVDVIATRMEQDAERETRDPDGNVDAEALLPALNEIAANTRMTVEAIQVLADASRENTEDKREVQEKVNPEKKPQKEKPEGVRKHMGEAASGVKDFFSKIASFFAMAIAFVAPLLIGPDSLFKGLNEFFATLRTFFTAITQFFLTNVVPAISFLFDKLVAFFNKLSGPLERLGASIADSLEMIGPKIWAVVEPILAFLGMGIVKAIEFLTHTIGLIGPAMDVIGGFISDIFDKFDFNSSFAADVFDKMGNWFETLMIKLANLEEGELMANFEIGLKSFWNNLIGLLQDINLWMAGVALPYTDVDMDDEQAVKDYYAGFDMSHLYFDIDRSMQKAGMIDFRGTDEEVQARIDEAFKDDKITKAEKTSLETNIDYFRDMQNKKEGSAITKLDSVNVDPKGVTDTGMFGLDDTLPDIKFVHVTGMKEAFPGFPYDDVYFQSFGNKGSMNNFGDHFVDWGAFIPSTQWGNVNDAGDIVPNQIRTPLSLLNSIERVLAHSQTSAGGDLVGTFEETAPVVPTPGSMVTTQQNIGTTISNLSGSSSGGGGGTNVLNNNINAAQSNPQNVQVRGGGNWNSGNFRYSRKQAAASTSSR